MSLYFKRFGQQEQAVVECDTCGVSERAAIESMNDDVVAGSFIKMTPNNLTARHGCVKCVRSGNAGMVEPGRTPQAAQRIMSVVEEGLRVTLDTDTDTDTAVIPALQPLVDDLPAAEFSPPFAETAEPNGYQPKVDQPYPSGSKVCITGKFEFGKRPEVNAALRNAGFEVTAHTPSADVVLLGARELPGYSSGKLRTAARENIPVEHERVFFNENVPGGARKQALTPRKPKPPTPTTEELVALKNELNQSPAFDL